MFFEHRESFNYQIYNGNAKILFLSQIDLFITLKIDKMSC